jgi:hypothetical protein
MSGLPRNSAAIPAFSLSCPTKKSSVLTMRSFNQWFPKYYQVVKFSV